MYTSYYVLRVCYVCNPYVSLFSRLRFTGHLGRAWGGGFAHASCAPAAASTVAGSQQEDRGDFQAVLCLACRHGSAGYFLLIFICNFHALNHLLLIFICKLHWNLLCLACGYGAAGSIAFVRSPPPPPPPLLDLCLSESPQLLTFSMIIIYESCLFYDNHIWTFVSASCLSFLPFL